MPEQLGLLEGSYWYSLITAAPRPEINERAAVAVLFGNGSPFLLRYYSKLPRLSCLARADEIRVYEEILASIADRVTGSRLDLQMMRILVGPQLTIESPRPLLNDFSDELVERTCRRWLSRPSNTSAVDSTLALVRRSVADLDKDIRSAKISESFIQRSVRPSKLYGREIQRHIGYEVPPLARAIRGFGRDVLVDALRINGEFDAASVRAASFRIGEAFYAYRSVRETIRLTQNREIRVVGILQPSGQKPTREVLLSRDFVRSVWAQQEAHVIDGDQEDVVAALAAEGEWALQPGEP
jgi:hypothetical protein